MSGSDQGRSPANDAELIRDMDARLRAVEQRQTLRLGDWVIGIGENGTPTLSKVDGTKHAMVPDPEPTPPTQGDAAFSGTCVRMSRRTVLPQFSLPGNGAVSSLLPTGVFDTLDYASTDMINGVDLNNGLVTVPSEGQYLVLTGIWLSAGMGSPRIWLSSYLNGTLYSEGQTLSGQQALSGMFVVRATAKGQTIQLGRANSSAEVGIGNATGTLTWMTVNRLP